MFAGGDNGIDKGVFSEFDRYVALRYFQCFCRMSAGKRCRKGGKRIGCAYG
ncbi:hypothetical protein KsCSTR_05810 [Candidatus Kuenenia stuttgartiensis]|uniref:Uncharacterized protein n=1 Tax=Kuenenia stuttgartiensis TaxID=174633 RepID=Q1PZZ4_KUEST|nr:hypothetical protein KsCSTR_05810 [Candidatus Kuenenia stuttgartiensis]CAJ72660.1 unknown protein [Candidatus Kuenenia stuttgartiensis]